MQGAKIDEDIDQSIEIGDGLLVTQSGTFDSQFFGLCIDPFGGGALFVNFLIKGGLPVELVT